MAESGLFPEMKTSNICWVLDAVKLSKLGLGTGVFKKFFGLCCVLSSQLYIPTQLKCIEKIADGGVAKKEKT